MKWKICWKPLTVYRKPSGLFLQWAIANPLAQYECCPAWESMSPPLLAEFWKTTRGSRGNAMRAKWRAWNWKWTIFRMRTASCRTCSRRKVMSMNSFAKRCPGSAVTTRCVMAFLESVVHCICTVCRSCFDLCSPLFTVICRLYQSWNCRFQSCRDKNKNWRSM